MRPDHKSAVGKKQKNIETLQCARSKLSDLQMQLVESGHKKLCSEANLDSLNQDIENTIKTGEEEEKRIGSLRN